MAQKHTYHWKHGWIPLTHTAAMEKAKGNKKLAGKYLDAVDAKHLPRERHITAGHRDGNVGLHDRKTGHTASMGADDAKNLHDTGRHITGIKSDGTVEHRAATPAKTPVESFKAAGGSEWVKYADGSHTVGSQNVSGMGYDQARSKHVQLDGGKVVEHGTSTAAPKVTKTDVYGDGRIDEVELPSGHTVQVERKTGRVTGGAYRPNDAGVDAITANPGAFTSHYVGRSDSHDDHMTLNGYTPGDIDADVAAARKRLAQPALNMQDLDVAHSRGHLSREQVRAIIAKDAAERDAARATLLKAAGDAPKAAPKVQVGDAVSIRGQANSRVTVAEVKDGRARVQNAFQTGAKGEWIPLSKLVPYGADTGRETPMGGRAVPGTPSTGSTIRRR